MAVALYEETRSAAWAAVAAFTRLVPYLVVSPFAGVVADRWGHRRILEVATALRIVLAVAVATAIAMDAPPVALALLALLATVAGTPVYPALNAFVPAVVPSSDLAAANSLLSTTETLGWIIGPAIGGLVVAISSASVTATTATVLIVLAFVVLHRVPRRAATPPAGDDEIEALWRALAGGMRALRHAGSGLAVLLLILATNLIDGAAQVLLLLVATERLGMGEAGYGTLTAVGGVGALAAVAVNRRLAAGPKPLVPLLTAVAVAGGCFSLVGVMTSPVAAIALLVLVAGACVVVEVVSVTILQRSVPPTHLARVFGLLDALMVGAIVVGAALAPVLERLLGLSGAMVVTGAIVPGVLAGLAPLVWRAGRVASARASRLQPIVTALGLLPLLRHAAEPVLEALALAGQRRTVADGEVVIREGEASDDVYLVLAGSFAVLQVGPEGPRLVNRRGTGECFGELGPLGGIARTATVVADGRAEVLRIPGDAFVAAVHGSGLGAGGSPVAGIVTRVANPSTSG